MLPLTDLDPVVLAEAAGAIRDAGAVAFLPSPEVALGCQDKWECHVMLTERGLPSPPTWLPDDVDPAELPYPVLLKPRLGFAGRHIYRCASAEELAFFRAYSPAESVVQQALPGLEFSIDCFGDLDGRALGAVPRAMIQSKGGEQIKGETLDDPQLVELGAATVEALGPRRARARCSASARTAASWGSPTSTRASAARSRCRRPPAPATWPMIIAIAAGERPEPRLGGHRPGVVMTRHLGQTLLLREPTGLAPLDGVL